MGTNTELLWISPEGEVLIEDIYHGPAIEHLLRNKPSGTLLRVTLYHFFNSIQWAEKIGCLTRFYEHHDLPPHIKLKCLLLGIEP